MSRVRLRLQSSDGSAIPEFIVIAVGILIPLAYVIVAVAHVLGAHAAAQHAVREAGRVLMRDTSISAGQWRAQEAANIAFADRGLELPTNALVIDCGMGACLQPGGTIDVRIAWDMPLPWLPAPIDDLAAVPIRAHQYFTIDSFRPAGV